MTRQSGSIDLSICITTFNRANFIGDTLNSIVSQLTDSCELVIVDGASIDNTEDVVTNYSRRFPNLRYFKQEINHGMDRDYDRSIELARGEYCWLMTDDDLLKPGAVSRVLSAVRSELSLILLNYQRFDLTLSEEVLNRSLDVTSDVLYTSDEMDRLFLETAPLLLYIGAVVIKRAIWLSRNRERYYDTMLMHVGVIFQQRLPGETLVIADPLIIYRDGNVKTFWPKMFEICLVRFPETAASFAISNQVKARHLFGDLRRPATLLFYRAMGWYSFEEYRRWISPSKELMHQKLTSALIALIPGLLANTYCTLKALLRSRGRKLAMVHLRMSPFYYRNYFLSNR